ncbi:TPA: hypothetical protein ACMDP0_000545 [Vibrio parahaemolyticus]|uniref:hypothetical protein n=1 Tax=Vibrio harveyi group TaxID=717610 RepID=UPI00111CC7D7|nr:MULTISPECIES: hypothetical protein [Vibrio harveyi group]EKK9971203.1 hypothetical protein [Vibrio parahaemolyticus]NOJ18257.1 hypothetical protein [Vibrio jasicida]TON12160.1 hypothetical protein CGH63_08010 [Vibrio parahaemolyticus]TOO40217.1 hypothetical protein CGH39_15275 [Vibrio parahaemolyticus]TOP29909.1 hypothetical protein CGH20_13665 [Vibrio parahaemolyticus]
MPNDTHIKDIAHIHTNKPRQSLAEELKAAIREVEEEPPGTKIEITIEEMTIKNATVRVVL